MRAAGDDADAFTETDLALHLALAAAARNRPARRRARGAAARAARDDHGRSAQARSTHDWMPALVALAREAGRRGRGTSDGSAARAGHGRDARAAARRGLDARPGSDRRDPPTPHDASSRSRSASTGSRRSLGPRRFAQWLVVGDDRMLLVDSGIDGTIAEHVVPALAELGLAPEAITDVVISHADVDHYGGNAELRRRRAASAASAPARSTAARSSRWDVIGRERYGWYRGHGLDYADAAWDWLQQRRRARHADRRRRRGGEHIDLGGIERRDRRTAGPLARPPRRRASRQRRRDRDGLGARARALHRRRRADQPTAVRDGVRLSHDRGAPARACAQRLGTSHYAPIEDRDAVTEFLDATESFIDDLDALVRGRLGGEPAAAARVLGAGRGGARPVPRDVGRARAIGGGAPRRGGRSGSRAGVGGRRPASLVCDVGARGARLPKGAWLRNYSTPS